MAITRTLGHKKSLGSYLVILEDASGMDIRRRNYRVGARNKKDATIRALQKEKYSLGEVKRLMKEREKTVNGIVYGGDVVHVEVHKI